ncbi:MAG: helix-turn-helix domain-containing protein [Candidatus Kariarchaeaceae archaeon]|jgi:predicted DNA binding protein
MPYEIRIKAQHDCPFLEFANMFSSPVHSYCSREFDIVEIGAKVDESQREMLERLFPADTNWQIFETGSTSYVMMNCKCEGLYEKSITTLVQQAGGIQEYPIRYHQGFEYHKVRCLNETALSQVIKEVEALPYLEILGIEDIGEKGLYRSQMISAFELLDALTSTQLKVLRDAFERGYYNIPRGVRTEDLATEYQVSRYAVDKSLRKAENKIIQAIMPYLLLKSRG